MDDTILTLLNKAGSFSEEEAMLLKNELQFREFKKDDFLLKKGDLCSSLCFVASGSFYQYQTDDELNKIVIDLSITHDWVISHKSFTSRRPSEYAVQAFEDSTLYEIHMEAIHKLIAKSQSFLQMGTILQETISRIDFFDNNNTPDEKYEFILKNKPDLLQKFPQKIIASYLKITPETLSRVRKRILKA